MRIILKPPQTVASPRRTGAVAATLIWRLASKAIVKGSPKVSATAAFFCSSLDSSEGSGGVSLFILRPAAALSMVCRPNGGTR